MSDLIDRQAAIEAGEKAADEIAEIIFVEEGINCTFLCIEKITEAITKLPSAQPERKEGRWNPYPIAEGCLQCSECGVLRMGEPCNYCPNCGAEMKGGGSK